MSSSRSLRKIFYPEPKPDAPEIIIDAAAPTAGLVKTDGTRPFTGNQSMGGNALTNIGYLDLTAQAEPTDPAANHTVIWMSNGTGEGDNGDVLLKTNIGGTVLTLYLSDYSRIAP